MIMVMLVEADVLRQLRNADMLSLDKGADA